VWAGKYGATKWDFLPVKKLKEIVLHISCYYCI
jgi:hypothetical protein